MTEHLYSSCMDSTLTHLQKSDSFRGEDPSVISTFGEIWKKYLERLRNGEEPAAIEREILENKGQKSKSSKRNESEEEDEEELDAFGDAFDGSDDEGGDGEEEEVKKDERLEAQLEGQRAQASKLRVDEKRTKALEKLEQKEEALVLSDLHRQIVESQLKPPKAEKVPIEILSPLRVSKPNYNDMTIELGPGICRIHKDHSPFSPKKSGLVEEIFFSGSQAHLYLDGFFEARHFKDVENDTIVERSNARSSILMYSPLQPFSMSLPRTAAPSTSSLAPPADCFSRKLFLGFATGMVQAIIFNPYDRALYMCIRDSRPFLHPLNWPLPPLKSCLSSPLPFASAWLKGTGPTIVQRAASVGFYFPLEQIALEALDKWRGGEGRDRTSVMIAGVTAGSVNGFLTTPANSVKYYMWNKFHLQNKPGDTLFMLRKMLREGGVLAFSRGASATFCRDIIFGATFSTLRRSGGERDEGRGRASPSFFANMGAAMCATMLSSPFNYIRFQQYSTPLNSSPPSVLSCLSRLLEGFSSCPSLPGKLHFLHRQLNVGWGSLRVGMGMAIGGKLYETLLKAGKGGD